MMQLKSKSMIMFCVVVLVSVVFVAPAMAANISIYPANPVVSSDGVFTADADKETGNVYVFLVLAKSCYDQLTGLVNVAWTGENGGAAANLDVLTWYGPISGSTKIPEASVIAPYSIKNGDGYTASSCRDHLGVASTEPLYYAWIPSTMVLSDDLVTITVEVPCENVNMLVYLVGQTDKAKAHEFDSRIPPTPAGLFVVPEYPLGALAAIGTCLLAFAVIKSKRSIKIKIPI
jgi:hypothetical protein